MAGHDAEHRLARADGAGAVGTGEHHAVLLLVAPHVALDADHVLRGDAVRDADAISDAGIGGFHDRIGREWRRHEDDRGFRARLLDRALDGVEDRPAEVAWCRPCRGSRRRRPWCRSRSFPAAWNVPMRPVKPWTRTRRMLVDANCHCFRSPSPDAAVLAGQAATAFCGGFRQRLGADHGRGRSIRGSGGLPRRWCRRAGPRRES